MTGATYLSGVLQVRAYRILQRRVGLILGQFDLKPTHWFILAQVCDVGQVNAAQIADMLIVEPPLITMLTDDLVAQGLIKKTGHPKDGRVKLLKITAKGQKLVPQIESLLQAALKDLLTGLKPADLKTYKRVLETIITNAK